MDAKEKEKLAKLTKSLQESIDIISKKDESISTQADTIKKLLNENERYKKDFANIKKQQDFEGAYNTLKQHYEKLLDSSSSHEKKISELEYKLSDMENQRNRREANYREEQTVNYKLMEIFTTLRETNKIEKELIERSFNR